MERDIAVRRARNDGVCRADALFECDVTFCLAIDVEFQLCDRATASKVNNLLSRCGKEETDFSANQRL
jgi:hypothetical protein